jgi:hypothetical protein
MFWLEQIEFSDDAAIENRKSKIANPKWLGDSAQRAGEGGQSDQVTASGEQ